MTVDVPKHGRESPNKIEGDTYTIGKYEQSCIWLHRQGASPHLVIDPGVLTSNMLWSDLSNALESGIEDDGRYCLVTHKHPDHFDGDSINRLLAMGFQVYLPMDVFNDFDSDSTSVFSYASNEVIHLSSSISESDSCDFIIESFDVNHGPNIPSSSFDNHGFHILVHEVNREEGRLHPVDGYILFTGDIFCDSIPLPTITKKFPDWIVIPISGTYVFDPVAAVEFVYAHGQEFFGGTYGSGSWNCILLPCHTQGPGLENADVLFQQLIGESMKNQNTDIEFRVCHADPGDSWIPGDHWNRYFEKEEAEVEEDDGKPSLIERGGTATLEKLRKLKEESEEEKRAIEDSGG